MITVDACVWVALLDRSDILHKDSVKFWRGMASSQTVIYAPVFLLTEVGCAVARRTQSAVRGHEVVALMREIPTLKLIECDSRLLNMAISLGTQHFLRAADALYLAVAKQTNTRLITWDKELISRAEAVSPESWQKQTHKNVA